MATDNDHCLGGPTYVVPHAALTSSTIITTTSRLPTIAGNTDAFVAWYAPSTDTLSLQQFGTPSHEAAGGVAADENGTVYVVGGAYLVFPRVIPESAGFLRAYASNRTLSWTRELRPGNTPVEGRAVIVDATRIAVGGSYDTTTVAFQQVSAAFAMVFPRQ